MNMDFQRCKGNNRPVQYHTRSADAVSNVTQHLLSVVVKMRWPVY